MSEGVSVTTSAHAEGSSGKWPSSEDSVSRCKGLVYRCNQPPNNQVMRELLSLPLWGVTLEASWSTETKEGEEPESCPLFTFFSNPTDFSFDKVKA